MISANQIQEFINLLPNIFVYIVPGFLFVSTFNFVRNSKNKELSKSIVEYVFISFMLVNIITFVLSFFYVEVIISLGDVAISIMLSAVVLGYGCATLINSNFYNKILNKINIYRSIHTNIFNELVDSKYGTWVRVYLKDEKIVYDGCLIKSDLKEKGDNSFIVLESYIVYKYGKSDLDNEVMHNDADKRCQAAIKVSDINRIEVTYNVNSEKINKSKVKDSKYSEILKIVSEIKDDIKSIKEKQIPTE